VRREVRGREGEVPPEPHNICERQRVSGRLRFARIFRANIYREKGYGLAGAAPSRFQKGNRYGMLCVRFLTGAARGEGVGPGDCCVLEVVNGCYKGVNF
jgi:hypothetical protein